MAIVQLNLIINETTKNNATTTRGARYIELFCNCGWILKNSTFIISNFHRISTKVRCVYTESGIRLPGGYLGRIGGIGGDS